MEERKDEVAKRGKKLIKDKKRNKKNRREKCQK